MKFNTKTRYGLRTMIELAMLEGDKGILQKDISKNQDISMKYLDHIVAQLKAAGLINNVAGKKSGYRLTRSADKISIYDIYRAFDHDLSIIDCLSEEGLCRRDKMCAARNFWDELNNNIINYMASVKLSDLSEKQLQLGLIDEECMYYI
ncbi:MAG: Rrf2 family transcriptional regulator [Bacteroidales bacterium]|nr:MAG: Rrf2 family transcriptional regulator [Bacteroidales bacterium]